MSTNYTGGEIMLKLGSTYLIVKDIDKSIEFYKKLLDMEVTAQNFTRWAQFNFGNHCIALFNPKYDQEELHNNHNSAKAYSDGYLKDYIQNDKGIVYGNNIVHNFYIDDLEKEYKRLQSLNIGELSKIMLINIKEPYYFFTIRDPDGNTLEITGNYYKEVD